MNIRESQPEGFTLVEALIATAVFVIVIVVALDLFLLFLTGPQSDVKEQELQEQMSYLSNFLAFEMRHAVVNYAGYGAAPCGSLPPVGTATNVLCIAGDNPVTVYLDTHPKTGSNDMMYYQEGGSPVQMISDEVAINSLEFFLYPNNDPFDVSNGLNNQPAVMMVIEARLVDDPDVPPLQYQTLITLREYGR